MYTERRDRFREKAMALESRYNRFSLIRLVLFFGIGALFFLLWSLVSPAAAFLSLVVCLFAFAKFVFWHQRIQKEQHHYEHLTTINEQEISFLNGDYSMFGDGSEFVDPQHPYTVDLDIFGAYSFFQYTNRTSTAIGKRCLANYLQIGEQEEEILARQAAILELKEKLDWRQDFQAKGMATDDSYAHILALQEWLSQPPVILGNKMYTSALYWVPPLAVIGVVLSYLFPWQIIIPFLAPAGYFLKKTVEAINKITHQTGSAEKIIAYYGELIEHIEEAIFESPKLKILQQQLVKNGSSASSQTKRLSYLIAQLNLRNNMFAIFLNILTIWDLQWTYRLEKWKEAHQTLLLNWFNALEEIEALISLSTSTYNNPEWNMPKISNENIIIGTAVGHPLIESNKRITNDFSIPTKGHIKLVTGSNMAGKSTLLRTVSLNIVLANCGAAVCAQSFQTPLLQVYTSMRTQDALHESTSSFYAELKRLKIIIEAVEAQENIFFVMDEILKGTNSNDRHTGSKALIKQLIKSKGSGIIATHDLELGALEASYGGAIENWCMEVEVNEGELVFDYKLKKGVSQSFNATQLMKNMGIRITE